MRFRVRHGLLLAPGAIFAGVMAVGPQSLELVGWRLWALPFGCAIPIGLYLWLERDTFLPPLRRRARR